MTAEAHLWSYADAADLQRLQAALASGDLAGALFAVEGAAPNMERPCRGRLRRWSRAVATLASGDDGPAAAAALRAVLVDEAGLQGNVDDRHAARNCHLSAVVESRRGMPILVSAVWMLVARDAGLTVEGVGLPGHFIARVGTHNPTLLDPFNRGRPLSKADCQLKVKQLSQGTLSWRDAFLDPSEDRSIVARTLRNLVASAEKSGDGYLLYRSARMLAEVRPDDASEQLRLAAVCEAIGMTPMAMNLYRKVMRGFSATNQARRARERLDHLRANPPTLH